VTLLVAGPVLGADTDADGIEDLEDNCPIAFNKSQDDGDGDGVGDACDSCLFVPNPRFDVFDPTRTYSGDQLDDDADGTGNRCDTNFTDSMKDEFVNVSDLLWFLDAYGKRVTDTDCPDGWGQPTGSCGRYDLNETDASINTGDLLVLIAEEQFGKPASGNGGISPALISLNEQIAEMVVSFELGVAEWVTVTDAATFGQTVFANDRSRQVFHQFVPSDPRRGGSTDLAYLVDQGDGATASGLSAVDTEGAIERAMSTWDEETQCSDVPLTKASDPGFDLGVVEYLLGYGGSPLRVSDIVHAGWLPKRFFDRISWGRGDSVLAVTFTAVFIDENGFLTDINGDGRLDVAFREIYYNDYFSWGIDVETNPYDVETVALHESGHGLSQNHFGKIFRTNPNDKLHYVPFAVMNAVISRQAQALEASDNGGHCSIWGSWPNH
jgi:hypothetical protein